MIRRLSTRLIIYIWGSTMVLFLAVMMINYLFIRKEMDRTIEEHSSLLSDYYAQKIDSSFQHAAEIPLMMSLHLESHSFEGEDELKSYMQKVLLSNPTIYASCIAFEPHAFSANRELYAPYYFKKEGKLHFTDLAKQEYNYLKWEWYSNPKKAQKPLWSEPYFDEGGGDALMLTYSVPFFREGRVNGVVTIDLELDRLADEINRIKVEKTGYGFLFTNRGKLVSFPNKSLIMKKNLKELAPYVMTKITNQKSGRVAGLDPFHQQRSIIVFRPIHSASLFVALTYPVKEVMMRAVFLSRATIWLSAAGLALLLFIVVLLSKSISRPISRLAAGAHRIAGGDLVFQIPAIPQKDEVGELTQSFNKMVADLKQHIADLRTTTAEKERLHSELKIAHEIQMSILPRTFPPFPNLPEFDIFAETTAAREMGGDFYDFFLLDEQRLGFVIADVSDKGVPAALFMAVTRTLLKTTAMSNLSPAQCLAKVNKALSIDNESSMFVTTFYGIFDSQTGQLTFCNAGHLSPLLIRSDSVTKVGNTGQIALGVLSDATYRNERCQLMAKDVLLLYTDGITEAMNHESELYSENRLLREALASGQTNPELLIEHVTQSVHNFAKGANQSDDITMLALTYYGREGQLKPDRIEPLANYSFKSSLDEIPRIQSSIESICRSLGAGDRVLNIVQVSLEEVITNIVRHAYTDANEHIIRVKVGVDDQQALAIEVLDDGLPFNPLEAEEVDTDAAIEDRPIGGLGIHLVKKMMDELAYRRENNKNILTMKKKMNEQGHP